GINRTFFEEVERLGIAAVVVIGSQLVLWLITAHLMTRLFRGDRITGLFASGPGGMAEMISVADQAGADSVKVGFVHLVRVSSIIILVPTLIIPALTS
ncbi:MAG: AbrB family transcriptional regulator, partial [Actinomycetota bacterium]